MTISERILSHLRAATANYPETMRERALRNLEAVLSHPSAPFRLEPQGFIKTGVHCGLQHMGREYSYLLAIKTDQGGIKLEAHGSIKKTLSGQRAKVARLIAPIGRQVVIDESPSSNGYIAVQLTNIHEVTNPDAEQSQVLAFVTAIAEILAGDGTIASSEVTGPVSLEEPGLTADQLSAASALEALEQLDLTAPARRRAEQGLLRRLRLEDRQEAPCDICGTLFSADLLVLAHIKPRAECDDRERRDYRHNTMLACTFGCDELFERHYIEIRDGVCVRGARKPTTDAVRQRIERLSGKNCLSWTVASAPYFRWHDEAMNS